MQKKLAAQLDTVHSTIGETLVTLLREKKVSVLKQAIATANSEISDTVTALATSPRSRSLLKTRKSLVSIENTLNGLSNGLTTQELSVKEFRAVCSNLQTKSVPNFVQNLADEVSKMPPEGEEPVIASTADVTDVVAIEADSGHKLVVNQRVKESLSAGRGSLQEQMAAIKAMLHQTPKAVTPAKTKAVEVEDDEHETEEERAERLEEEREAERLRREGAQDVASIDKLVALKGKRKGLPTRLTRLQPYSIAKLPLIPVFGDAFVIEGKNSRFERTLNQLAIKFTVVQGYAFLEDQLILSISRTDVDNMNLDHKEAVKLDARGDVKQVKKAQKSNEAQLDKIDAEIEAYADQIQQIASTKVPRLIERITAQKKALIQLKKVAASINSSKAVVRKAKADIEAGEAQLKRNETIKKKLERQASELKDQIAGAGARKADLSVVVERRTEDIKAIRKKARPKYNEVTPYDYAMTVVAHINEISSGAYALVSEDYKVNVRNADILCFWIMPATKLSRFMKLGTKLQWAFPWDE